MAGLMVILHSKDETALLYVVGRRRQPLDRAVRVLTHAGGATSTIVVSLLLLLGPVPAWHATGARIAFGLVASHLAVQLLKRLICRARPRLPIGAGCLIDAPDRFSFPSGHAAAALSVALPLAATAVPLLAVVLIASGLLVGLTRCYLGVHYPGDVVAGWLLAAAAFTLGAGIGIGF